MRTRPIPSALRDHVELVVADNADDLLRYLRRRVTQPEDAADLLGRVLLAIWESSSRLPTTDHEARMWCFGVARNILREHYRHTAKQLALADGLRDHLRASAATQDGADTIAEANIRFETVRRAVGALDDRSRELIMLIHWDGFSIAESARISSMNESTARTRHARALKRLEKQLGRGAPDPEDEQVRTRDRPRGARWEAAVPK
jgi:RNA polymerase sigma-70 factor (ECF subfamily)